MVSAVTVEQTTDQGRKGGATPPRSGTYVSSFSPITASAQEIAIREQAFQDRFLRTMRGEGSSLLSTDVYHDTTPGQIEYFRDSPEDYHSLQIILGGNSWKAVNSKKAPHDQELIDAALDKGLLNCFNEKSLCIVSYGPGPNGTATDKEGRIIAKAIASGFHISGFTGIDINRTFASESSTLLGDRFSIESRGMQGDFVWGPPKGLPEISHDKNTAKVITVFGNTPFNAASFTRDGARVSYRDSVENFFSKMNIQNGLGHYLIISVDTDQNPRAQEKKYAVTPEHERLILTPYAVARLKGIINEPYPILAHWRMAVKYDSSENTVLMLAEAKSNHQMPIANADPISFCEGDTRVIMASHKWLVHEHTNILGRSGYEICETFDADYNPHKLIVAKAVREPRRSPF